MKDRLRVKKEMSVLCTTESVAAVGYEMPLESAVMAETCFAMAMIAAVTASWSAAWLKSSATTWGEMLGTGMKRRSMRIRAEWGMTVREIRG